MALARFVARAAHERRSRIGQKSVPELTGRLVGSFDVAITERCFSYDEGDAYGAYARAGEAIFDAEHTDETRSPSDGRREDAERLGVSVILATRDPTRNDGRCP